MGVRRMERVRTQIYLDPDQHRALRREARRAGLSMAALIRRLLDEHLRPRPDGASRKHLLGLVGLWDDPRPDVSEDHDRYLGDTLCDEDSRRY